MKVVVVGGGVVGLCCAWHLHRLGAEVEVLEGNDFGRGASRASAGWVVPSLSTPLAAPGILGEGIRHALDPKGALVIRPGLDMSWIRWLWRFRAAAGRLQYEQGVRALMNLNLRTIELFDQLVESGVEFEMHAAGVLAVARDRGHMSWFTQLFGELTSLGYKGEMAELSAAEIRAVEPALSRAVAAGVLTSIDRHVEPDSLIRGLVADLRRRGVALRERVPVQGLEHHRSGWNLTTSEGIVSAPVVVLALGARINDLLRQVGARLPIVGGKGYAVDLHGNGTLPLRALYLMEPKIGLSPYAGGVLRVAGVFELPGTDDTAHARRVRQIVDESLPFLRDWYPVADGWEKRGRAGLRPCTADSLPFLGPLPGADGLYLATGHGMLGVTLAPASGEVIADMIFSRKISETLLPFQVTGRV